MRKFAICFNGSNSWQSAKYSSKMHNGEIFMCLLYSTNCYIKKKTDQKITCGTPHKLLQFTIHVAFGRF